jgi:hypothetical protein
MSASPDTVEDPDGRALTRDPQSGPCSTTRLADDSRRSLDLFAGLVVMVETLANFLSCFEKRNGLAIHRHIGACAWVTANPRLTILDRESPEAAQLDAVATGERCNDLVEDRVDDSLDITLIEVRVLYSDTLDELGLDHRPGGLP